MPQDVANLVSDRVPLMAVADALARRLAQDGRSAPKVDADIDLIESGLVDSQALLDIILEVEGAGGWMFDADGMDFERGVTLRRLAAAFAAPA